LTLKLKRNIIKYNLNIHIYNVKEWFDNNLLELNIIKYKYIYFINISEHNLFNKITIHSVRCNSNCDNCIILKQVNVIKYLGITIDSKLKWDTHINNLTNTVRKIFYIFHDIRSYLIFTLSVSYIYS
jgi:hypothetical protein